MSNSSLVGKNTDTKVKYITSKFHSMPQIFGNWGELIKVLKKVLCDGGDKSRVVSIEVDNDNKILTIEPEQGHFTETMVVRLEGVSEDIDGEYRILKRVSANGKLKAHFKPGIETISEPVDTTEESKIYLAPLGWEIIYDDIENTGVAQFKNKSAVASGVLKVIDALPPNGYKTTWAKFARICFGQRPDGEGGFINNEKSPKWANIPNPELTGDGVEGERGKHGWDRWIYSSKLGPHVTYVSTDSGTNKHWAVIGDDRTFYLFIAGTGDQYTIYSFGNYDSNLENDPHALVSHSCIDWGRANEYISGSSDTEYGSYSNKFTELNKYNTPDQGRVFTTALGNHVGNLPIKHFGLFPPASTAPDKSNYWPTLSHTVSSVSPSTGKMLTSPIYFVDSFGDYRGSLRGIQQPYGDGFLLESGTLVGGDMIAMSVSLYQSSSKTFYLFSLKDWK